MAYYTNKNQICNLTMSLLGSKESVSDIETPTNDVEIQFALHYDITRQELIKKMLPNFALRRRYVAQEGATTSFGYGFIYEYPQDCLRLLGIGEISDKENDYVVEADDTGALKIWTDTDAEDGLPIRYVHDETDVVRFPTDFVNLFAQTLAARISLPITQNPDAMNLAKANAKEAMASSTALQAQENRPVRVSDSRFKKAKYANITSYPTKR